jgi:hypothetical protein
MTDQPFADIPIKGEQSQTKKNLVFTKIIPGYPVRIRILNSAAYRVPKHFLPRQKVSVVCLGEDCPVCIQNRKQVEANPGVPYSEVPGIINKQVRFLVSVYNRTLVKKIGEEVFYAGVDGKFPRLTDKGEDLTKVEAKPLNTVEILERGSTLFAQFNAINDSFRNDEGERIGITNFDIILTASGGGKNMVITALPALQHSDEVKVENALDLSTVSIKFSPDEIWKLLGGVPVRDIFESRKGTVIAETADASLTDMAKSVEDSLEAFFTEG